MKILEEIELHDALLKTIEIDIVKMKVTVGLEYYSDLNQAKREAISIVFEEVESINQISDLVQLKKNAFAGNVNYWSPCEYEGITYIYLSDGCISIKAGKILIET